MPTGTNNQLKISQRVLLICATINWQQMFENTMPTIKVKQRGSVSRILVGETKTHKVVNEKKVKGATSGRIPSHKVRFLPVPSRWALEIPKTVR